MLCRDLDLDFEIPFRELGFHGVPHRTTAFVMPTVTCLVELIEMPFTVCGELKGHTLSCPALILSAQSRMPACRHIALAT